MTRQVILDTETTGLNPGAGDRIIEVAAVELVGRRLSGVHFHRYVNPGRSSHPDALRVHGLTDEFLADKPPFERIAGELIEFVRDAEVIIHNAAFDVSFLDAEFDRLGLPGFTTHCAAVTDSLAIARSMFPGKFNSLDALCKRFGIDNSHRTLHGALLDAELLAEVYVWLTRGQESLVIDVDDAGAQAAEARVDLSAFTVPVLRADAAEVEAHEAILRDLAKSCPKGPVWAPGASIDE